MMRVVVTIAVLLAAGDARAHQTSVKYIDLTVTDDHHVEVAVRFAPGDVNEALGLAPDVTPDRATVLTDKRVQAFVLGWFSVDGCLPQRAAMQGEGTTLVATWFELVCTGTTRELALDFTRFFALDTRHEALVRLTAPGAAAIQTIVRAHQPKLTLHAGHSPSLLAWVRTGMDHIYSGIDHILFVVSLLLVVMLHKDVASPSSPIQRSVWHTRALGLTLRSTAVVITSFTIAHSITLISAALGLVALPSRIVEALIAASIAYTAAEDVVKPDVRWRFVLTFAFGLVHGLGFAATLSELLPPTDVIVPLLCFNVGVEIGQLTIVLVVLPVLWLAARKIGAAQYRRYALPLLAAPIFVIGVAMVVQRVS